MYKYRQGRHSPLLAEMNQPTHPGSSIQLGTNSVNAQAFDAIQKVQKRAGYAQDQLTTTTDPTAFTTAVFNERGWEFFAEMKRWFELVRLEKVSEVRAETWNGSLFQSNNHYYFPIPYQQIRLTQWTNNAGY